MSASTSQKNRSVGVVGAEKFLGHQAQLDGSGTRKRIDKPAGGAGWAIGSVGRNTCKARVPGKWPCSRGERAQRGGGADPVHADRTWSPGDRASLRLVGRPARHRAFPGRAGEDAAVIGLE